MTDHIIKAAKAAGGTTYTNRHHDGTACAFGPEALERFYAIAFAAGMERAAALMDENAHMFYSPKAAYSLAAEVRAEAHAQNQTEGN